jgi:PadR family transcriptional regulator, regulatory protein PadR
VAVLGELEQIVLLAVMRIGEGAYGVPIHAEIGRLAKRDLSIGSIYKTLSRLEEKGFVESTEGPPTAQRGGRRTRVFAITPAGRRTLRATLATIRRLSAGLDVGFDKA